MPPTFAEYLIAAPICGLAVAVLLRQWRVMREAETPNPLQPVLRFWLICAVVVGSAHLLIEGLAALIVGS